MTALDQLNRYLRNLTRKLRLLAFSRGVALTAALSLGVTILLAAIANRYQFAPGVVGPLRLLLYLLLAASLFFALLAPLLKLTVKRVTRLAERSIPGLEERLLTAAERPDPANPFTELVAEDALRVAHAHASAAFSSWRGLWAWTGAASVIAAALLWLIVAGPGIWGYGASLLWTGSSHGRQRPLYEVTVQPGDKTIRRKSGQVVQAQLIGFSAHRVTLHARAGAASKWEEAIMQPGSEGDRYQFLFPSVTDATEYYVQADSAQSRHFTISVKDLPAVKRVRTTIHFPSALGLQPVSDETGGDVRAVEGSTAEISILTDRPLAHGVLVLDKGQKIDLTPAGGNWLKASLPVARDGSYHVAAIDAGETIRISDDFFIEARKDEPPTVKIARPGHDPRVSPIEEVPVSVEATDDFGVRSLELHYSVNGGVEQVARFRAHNAKEENGHTTLYLENFKLAPGDVISMYAAAADANKTVRSDILFAQAEAYDYKFSQSQQAGNMGGAGGAGDNNISERQKQIIAATFNQLRGNSPGKNELREQARFLSDLEGKLGAQAKTLAERMGNRELTQANSEFENFSKLMTSASGDMGTAAQQLNPGKWNEALVPEQKALQSLLRAEAIFRDIQVAFGQQGGGSGANGAQRELARMFDLELDTSKNQYETAQQGGGAAEKQQQALDQAFERLQMLARRQQELAEQHNSQQMAEQRWQEEQLRREAEELKRQLQQLAQNGQSGAGQPSQQQQQQQDGQKNSSNSGQGSEARNREMNEATRQASEALSQAEDEMRKAVGSGDAGAQQRAMGQLAEAERRLGSALHRTAGNSLGDLASQADSIAARQRELARRMKQMYSGESAGDRGGEYSSQLGGSGESGDMPEMNDPDNPRFGYGYRRRNWLQDARPAHRASEAERGLAEDKEKLASEVEQLQRDMEGQRAAVRSSSPQAARQLERALSDAEQKELALRMQKNAQWMREGYGDRNLGMEDNVTAGLDQLSRDLHGAQQTLETATGDGKGGQSEKTAQALAQVRQLREMLERAQAGKAGLTQNGAAQNSSAQNGAARNGSPQAAPSGQNQASGQAGAPGPAFGGNGSDNPNLSQRDIDQAIGRLSALRGQISGQDRALGNYLGGTLGHLRDLNADPKVLQDAIGQDTLASLERLEAELSRRLGEQQIQNARTGAAEKPAEQYRDAVADYFKKLSQTTPKN